MLSLLLGGWWAASLAQRRRVESGLLRRQALVTHLLWACSTSPELSLLCPKLGHLPAPVS